MRRFLLLLVILTAVLCCPVAAANTATGGELSANILETGSCQVFLKLQLNLDTAADPFLLPLPATARSITVNGSTVRVQRTDTAVTADISDLLGGLVGTYTLQVQYTLPNVLVYQENGSITLKMPMLSGLAMAVDRFSFTVTLPAGMEAAPRFFSGYYKQSIEADMTWTVSGNQITGQVHTQLKDRETLEMELDAPEGIFPARPVATLDIGFEAIALWICAALALLYWLIFLAGMPLLPLRTAAPPEGCAAGQIPCRLMGRGADLTMTVFFWAQLGYILIHTDDHGRVRLHKRMEMGNERSPWEVRLFHDLFGKHTTVDGLGYRYANLCRRVAASCPERKNLFRKGGSVRLFRALSAGAGLFFGVELGIRLAGDALLGILLIVLVAALSAVASWVLHGWIRGVQLHYRHELFYALAAAGALLLLGLLGGMFGSALWMVLGQALAGLLAAYGGRRTEMGRQSAAEILGLRRYLTGVTTEEIHLAVSRDPGYFFTVAPWALMLGAEKSFAARFGKERLPSCPWLTSGMDAHMTASEWAQTMRQTARSLDRLQRRLPLERLTGK